MLWMSHLRNMEFRWGWRSEGWRDWRRFDVVGVYIVDLVGFALGASF
jgi:hypothetical protein